MDTKVVNINYEGRIISFSSILKPKEYYEANKQKFNKNCNLQYKKINGRPYIGDNSWLFKELKPENYQDFFNKYLEYNTIGVKSLNPNEDYKDKWCLKKCEKCGRTLEDLIAIARYYKKLCPNVDYPLEDFFDDLVNHIIIETYDGHQAERCLKNFLISKDFNVEETDGDFDANFGVDLIVKKNNQKKYIQVKPISTFIGNNNDGLIKDRINFFKKQQKLDAFLNEHNEIIYMLYNKNLMDKTNKIEFYFKGSHSTFKLNELIDKYGYTLTTYNDFYSRSL